MSLYKKIISHQKPILLCLISCIVGTVSTMGVFLSMDNSQTSGDDYSIRQSGYRFINPLLECEVQNKIERQKYIPFEEVTINRINQEIIDKNPSVKVGVYFRNLNNGPWFGINENEYYSPASILKVPIFITYLKWAEQDPNIWNKKMPITSDSIFTHYFPPSKTLVLNQEYDIMTLIEHMIKYSDNYAMGALVKAIPRDLYSKVNMDLGITVPGIKTPEDYLSVKDMATFFRILYNASYLERESSEYALKVLSETDFDKGLRAGVPSSVLISHKFGERGHNDEKLNKYIKQLHDCGIVYYQKYPYLACVVTKGDDYDINSKIIADTSKIIFEEVSKAFPEN